jgi:hypothetical protein
VFSGHVLPNHTELPGLSLDRWPLRLNEAEFHKFVAVIQMGPDGYGSDLPGIGHLQVSRAATATPSKRSRAATTRPFRGPQPSRSTLALHRCGVKDRLRRQHLLGCDEH